MRTRLPLRGPPLGNALATAMLAAWLVVVVALLARHGYWRDEVRALSIATRGDSVPAMLAGLRGEGHPALWYLLLRAGHGLIGNLALPVVSAGVAAAAMALFLWRAPFGVGVKALVLLGRFALFEYSVMARNYGISMLLMFAFAALYPRIRERGVAGGAILLLLANSNVHSALLALALMAFWCLDLIAERGGNAAVLRQIALNAALVGLGVVLCALTVYPPVNDAASRPLVLAAGPVLRAIVDPGSSFAALAPALPAAVLSIVLFAGTLVLASRPAALLAALGALVAMSLLFALVYTGDYRHVALWLVFLLSLAWIVLERGDRDTAATRIGGYALWLLLAVQAVAGVGAAAQVRSTPFSRSRDLAALIRSDATLTDAIVLADPDYMVEPLPYYLANRTWLLREDRFGAVATFTRHARTDLTLDELLSTAQRLRRAQHAAVLILLTPDLDPRSPARVLHEGYDWRFATTPASVARFLSATTLVRRLPPALGDESYAVYRLR